MCDIGLIAIPLERETAGANPSRCLGDGRGSRGDASRSSWQGGSGGGHE